MYKYLEYRGIADVLGRGNLAVLALGGNQSVKILNIPFLRAKMEGRSVGLKLGGKRRRFPGGAI